LVRRLHWSGQHVSASVILTQLVYIAIYVFVWFATGIQMPPFVASIKWATIQTHVCRVTSVE